MSKRSKKSKASAIKVPITLSEHVPDHKRSKNNNPTWDMYLSFEVTRMDNSITMAQHWGTLSRVGKVIADVSVVPGGFVFVLTIKNEGDTESRRYALDVMGPLKTIAALDERLAAVPKIRLLKPAQLKNQ